MRRANGPAPSRPPARIGSHDAARHGCDPADHVTAERRPSAVPRHPRTPSLRAASTVDPSERSGAGRRRDRKLLAFVSRAGPSGRRRDRTSITTTSGRACAQTSPAREGSPVSSTTTRSVDSPQASRTAPRTRLMASGDRDPDGFDPRRHGGGYPLWLHAVRVNEPRPCCHAIRTASTFVCTPSLARMFFTWLCTVSGLMPNSSASSVGRAAVREPGEDLALATGEGRRATRAPTAASRAPQSVHQAGQILGRQHELTGVGSTEDVDQGAIALRREQPHAPAARASVAASAPEILDEASTRTSARASRIALTISMPRPSRRSRSTSTRSARPSPTISTALHRAGDGTEDCRIGPALGSPSRSPCVSSELVGRRRERGYARSPRMHRQRTPPS